MLWSQDDFDMKLPKIVLPKLKGLNYRVSSREPLPAKVKNVVRERAKNTCEYLRCKEKEFLEFHHINMKNSDSGSSNIELLCCKHHRKRHSEKIRKIIGYDWITGEKKTRLVKKPKKKRTTKKKTTRKKKLKDIWDI